jgi:hypothetical protein
VRFVTLLQLLIASFVVGLVLNWLDLEPTDLVARARAGLVYAWAQLRALTGGLLDSAGDVVGYVLIGAVVVVPIWLVSVAWRALRRRG